MIAPQAVCEPMQATGKPVPQTPGTPESIGLGPCSGQAYISPTRASGLLLTCMLALPPVMLPPWLPASPTRATGLSALSSLLQSGRMYGWHDKNSSPKGFEIRRERAMHGFPI